MSQPHSLAVLFDQAKRTGQASAAAGCWSTIGRQVLQLFHVLWASFAVSQRLTQGVTLLRAGQKCA